VDIHKSPLTTPFLKGGIGDYLILKDIPNELIKFIKFLNNVCIIRDYNIIFHVLFLVPCYIEYHNNQV
jgi:hypothetical protein